MTRRSLLSMLVACIALMTFGFLGGAQTASAQQKQNLKLCYYTVDIAGIAPDCLPITLTTEWRCPDGSIRVETKVYNMNGVYAETLNPPGAPPCPPACMFNWASVNGTFCPVPLGVTSICRVGNCCYIVTSTTDAAGAILIKIRPCPNDTTD